ncbi:MAG: glutamate-1-semialdehyde 2,1-aminomutase [Planctomycetota bacterium]
MNTHSWNTRARAVTPGGVHSPVRAFNAVGGMPTVIERAAGAYLYDADGRAYVDLIGSWGAAILGHAHPAVTTAIGAAAHRGASYGLTAPNEIRLSEEIVARVPGLERVRLVNSGTEAVMSALRLARAATGRERIIKCAGCYHGHADALLSDAGSGLATLGIPASPGVPQHTAETTITVPFGDADAVAAVLEAHPTDVAAVIVEPVAGNMGVIPPPVTYLNRLRRLTDTHGALLVFDEVMTGFRLARGGAQERFDVTPDLSTFGKVIGGGLPVGAFGGRADLMDRIAPAGPVYQAGTMSGNPIATAAGLAALSQLDDEAYLKLERTGATLERGLTEVFRDAQVPAAVQRVGSMISVFFSPSPVGDFDAASTVDRGAYTVFFQSMLTSGVHLPPSPLEAWFVSLAHTDREIDRILEAAATAAHALSHTSLLEGITP